MNQGKQRTPQRLNPLALTPSLAKKRVPPARYVSQQYQRYKTEGIQGNSAIFQQKGVERHHSVSEREAKKEYMIMRQHEMRRDYDRQKLKMRSGDLSLPMKKKSVFDIQSFEDKLVKRPFFAQNVQNLKVKDLQCNMLHLLRIFDNLLKKKESRSIIQNVKRYILEEESDLNELQLCLADQKDQLTVKYIIFHERVLLILLIESMINKRYRFNEHNFLQLFKELLDFYSLIYFQLTQKPMDKFIETHQLRTVLPHLQKQSLVDITILRDNFGKKISIVSKQFGELDQFIGQQNSFLKSYPSNLLYYNLLEFYAGRLTGGEWSSWGVEFLQTCPSPYVHHNSIHKYTLLLDLDETLVHYRTTSQSRGEFLLRPNLFSFLSQLQPHFQLGIFTCALQSYADLILEHMPMITIKLYRQHAVRVGKQLVKDLSRVGRDLSRVILVDNLDKNFQLQKQNGIHVRSWYGDPTDDILIHLGKQLQRMAKKDPSDLRKSCHKRSFL